MNLAVWGIILVVFLFVLLIMRVSKLYDMITELELFTQDCVTQEQFKAWKKTQSVLQQGGQNALFKEMEKGVQK